ncbi:hypothetical protein AAG906_037491 [Vitis piasezkii]
MDYKDTHVTTAVHGTYLSTSPLEGLQKTDVYGYGIMLLELITGQSLIFGRLVLIYSTFSSLSLYLTYSFEMLRKALKVFSLGLSSFFTWGVLVGDCRWVIWGLGEICQWKSSERWKGLVSCDSGGSSG